jgi:type II secretory pathway pseudopilin PulG
MEDRVAMHMSSSKGFSLLETVIAIGVLTTGVLGTAGVLVTGMKHLSSSPADVVVTQKAAQAIEAVFSARDTGKLTWNQINNVSHGGVFVDGFKDLKLAGPDGLVNTADDESTIEWVKYPGVDQKFGTSDDKTVTLSAYKRQITITDESPELRRIVVKITYNTGTNLREYTLTTFISTFS